MRRLLTQPARTIGRETTWWLERRGDAIPRTSKSVIVAPCLAGQLSRVSSSTTRGLQVLLSRLQAPHEPLGNCVLGDMRALPKIRSPTGRS